MWHEKITVNLLLIFESSKFVAVSILRSLLPSSLVLNCPNEFLNCNVIVPVSNEKRLDRFRCPELLVDNDDDG